MRPQREASKSRADRVPEVDDEREVDLGRYLYALVARWWLPSLGLLIGVALGYLVSASSKEVWRPPATVSSGSPAGSAGSSRASSTSSRSRATIAGRRRTRLGHSPTAWCSVSVGTPGARS